MSSALTQFWPQEPASASFKHGPRDGAEREPPHAAALRDHRAPHVDSFGPRASLPQTVPSTEPSLRSDLFRLGSSPMAQWHID